MLLWSTLHNVIHEAIQQKEMNNWIGPTVKQLWNYGCRSSSVNLSALTILLTRVRVPSTPSMLFEVKFVLYLFVIVLRKVRKKQKETGFGPFLNNYVIMPCRCCILFWGFNINTTAFNLGQSNLHLLLLKSSMCDLNTYCIHRQVHR